MTTLSSLISGQQYQGAIGATGPTGATGPANTAANVGIAVALS